MFLLKSLIYPLFSASFYREAYNKGLKKSLGVYAFFTFVISIIATIYFAFTLGAGLMKLPEEFKNFPEINVQNGELEVNGLDMPYEYFDEGRYLGIDTTGELEEIPDGYNEGFLLTKDTIIVRSKNNYGDQTITYSQLLKELNRESIHVDGKSLANTIQTFGVLLIVVSPFAIFFFNFVFRIIWILIVSLFGYVVLSLMKKQNAYRKSLTIAVYASIPVYYLSLLISLFESLSTKVLHYDILSACCLIGLFITIVKWSIFYGIGINGIENEEK